MVTRRKVFRAFVYSLNGAHQMWTKRPIWLLGTVVWICKGLGLTRRGAWACAALFTTALTLGICPGSIVRMRDRRVGAPFLVMAHRNMG